MSLDNIKSVKHRFSESETQAILCVLPLITQQASVTLQMKKNLTDAMAKLDRRAVKFSGAELSAIVAAVALSIQLLSGKLPGMMQSIQRDTGWYEEIKHHYFVLNRLHHDFQELEQEVTD